MELPGKPTDRVSHWILNHTARIPAMDEVLFFDNLEVRIHDASQRRIRQVAIRRTSDPAIEGEDKERETASLPAPG
jgi:CBS domain containing-hemolysin-like protein